MNVIGRAGCSLSLLALGLLGSAGWWYQRVDAFVGGASMAAGKIVDYAERSNDAVVRFDTPAGQAIQFRSNVSGRWPVHPIVPVLYREDQPHAPVINEFHTLWAGPFCLALMGSAFLLAGALLLLAWRSDGSGGGSSASRALSRLTPRSRAWRFARRWLVEVPAQGAGFGAVGAGLVALCGLWSVLMLVPFIDERGMVTCFPVMISTQVLLLAALVPLALLDRWLPDGDPRPFDAQLALRLVMGQEAPRRKLVRALVRHDPRDVVPHLLRWLEHDHLEVRRAAASALAALRWQDEGCQRRAIELATGGRLSELLALQDRAPREVLTALRIVALRFSDPDLDQDVDLALLGEAFLMFGHIEAAQVLRQNLPGQPGAVAQTMRQVIDRLEGAGHRLLAAPSIGPPVI